MELHLDAFAVSITSCTVLILFHALIPLVGWGFGSRFSFYIFLLRVYRFMQELKRIFIENKFPHSRIDGTFNEIWALTSVTIT